MHKHFLIALLVGAGTLLAASCSEESATVRQRTLEVVSSDTNFPVDGGSRTVTTARAATTAYAQDKWAQVQVENGQVIVKTDVNTDEQSRNTLLVIKDARGDSASINVRQDGMIFRLPTSATVESDDQALQRSFHVQFNVPVNITSSAPWIQVSHTPEGDVTFKVTANTSGRPRVGWLLSHAHGLTDSVRITQATLSDIVGTYRQHASTLDSSRTRMIDTTNVVTISKISDTKALFSIDGNLNWECEFRPGQGLYMNNGKVLREVKSKLDVVSHAYNLFSQTFRSTVGRAAKFETKAGRWIGNAGVALGVAMELYDWYEAKQRNERVAELQHTLRESVNEIFSGIFKMFDSDERYYSTFAPSYPEMLRLIGTREEELQQMQQQSDSLGNYRDRIRQWMEHDITDAEIVR